MAKYLRYKDLIRRKKLSNSRIDKLIGFSLRLNEKADLKAKFKFMLKQQSYYKTRSSIAIPKNRCINTNFSRGINRLTNLSKSEFKKSFNNQFLTGFKKSSW